MPRFVTCLAIVVLYGLPAFAQIAADAPRAWTAAARRLASSAGYCPAGPIVFELMSDGAKLHGKDPGGATFTAPMGPDGSISVTYRTSVGRSARIVGNGRTGQLQLLAGPNDACRYEFTSASPEESVSPTRAPAQRVRICEQMVEYRPRGISSPSINGVWEGTIDFGIRYSSCHGFVVEGLIDKTSIVVQQAWNNSNGANSDVRGLAYLGTGAAIITQQSAETFTIGNALTLRLMGNKLVGKYHSEKDKGDHDVLLYKRQ